MSYELEIEKLDVSKLIEERTHLYKKIFSDEVKQDFELEIEKNIELKCDKYYLTQAIDNIINNAVDFFAK